MGSTPTFGTSLEPSRIFPDLRKIGIILGSALTQVPYFSEDRLLVSLDVAEVRVGCVPPSLDLFDIIFVRETSSRVSPSASASVESQVKLSSACMTVMVFGSE